MNAIEALKQARELLGRAEIALRLTNEDEFDELAAAARLVRADLRAFLALPSPVEEGTWNEAVEAACRVIGSGLTEDSDTAKWIAENVRALRRDTSKPEEKRYTVAEVIARIEGHTDYWDDEGFWNGNADRIRAALTGEKP